MGDDKDKKPFLPISGVLAIVAALGITLYSQPFKGARPPTPDHQEHYAKVNARLWQDPFRAVLESEALKWLSPCKIDITSGKASPSADKCPTLAAEFNREDNLIVLGIMVPGGPYAEDSETRMRYRYAVLSGLGRLGYVPEDAEHIRRIKILGTGQAEDQYSLSNIMPVEWFGRAGDGTGARVLIAWMNEGIFEEKPLKRIELLATYLGPFIKPHKSNFKVIGPARSDTLRAMIKDGSWPVDRNKDAKCDKGNYYQIYSATATVDDRTLLVDAECEKTFNKERCDELRRAPESMIQTRMKEIFSANGFEFIRTIRSDRNIARALIGELELRHVDLKNEKILLVAEWDTYYGRSFEKYFKHELYEKLTGQSAFLAEVGDQAKLEEIGRRVRRASYLRGINGVVPGKDEKKGKETKETNEGQDEKKSDASKERKKLEQAVGASQYDYIRRLAEELRRLNAESRHEGRGEIGAIGVVGSDFYDKYLVLQALHQKFPDAVYFTTDLDARYLHPDNIKWTRNLVVASHFNLSLRKDERKDDGADIQGEIPPFRESYQTSIFFAVLKAFRGQICSQPHSTGCREVQLLDKSADSGDKPMIFEIGHKKAVLLTDLERQSSIHPLKDPPYRGGWKVYAVAVLVFLFLIVTSTYVNSKVKWFFHVQRAEEKTEKGASAGAEPSVLCRIAYGLLACVLTLAAVAGFAWLICAVSGCETEEPFSITEGMSVWPTEILRLTAFVLSWFFFYSAYLTRRRSTEHIAKDFHFDEWTPGGMRFKLFVSHMNKLISRETWTWKNAKKVVATLRKLVPHKTWTSENESGNEHPWISDVMDLSWEPVKFQDMNLKQLYQAYRDHDRGYYRFWRVLIIAALYVGFCMLIVSYDWPVSPLRGRNTFLIDQVMLYLCVFSFVILVAYVFDVTTACRRFIMLASRVAEKHTPENNREARERIKTDLTLIRLVAQRSADIQKLIFYPFIVWLVIIASRLNYFDNWKIHVGLGIVLSLGAAYAWASALLLRLTAEKARGRIIHWFKDLQAGAWLSSRTARQAEEALVHITSIRTGAFAPLSQHPVLHVVFMVIGSLGGMFSLDFLSKLNL